MTHTEPIPTGRELDAWIAEVIVGLRNVEGQVPIGDAPIVYTYDLDPEGDEIGEVPKYSEDLHLMNDVQMLLFEKYPHDKSELVELYLDLLTTVTVGEGFTQGLREALDEVTPLLGSCVYFLHSHVMAAATATAVQRAQALWLAWHSAEGKEEEK